MMKKYSLVKIRAKNMVDLQYLLLIPAATPFSRIRKKVEDKCNKRVKYADVAVIAHMASSS